MSVLAHLKVIDLIRVRTGPTCCRVLADFGDDEIADRRARAIIQRRRNR